MSRSQGCVVRIDIGYRIDVRGKEDTYVIRKLAVARRI